MIDFMVLLLFGLTPFNTAIADEATQVNPINESCLKRILMKRRMDGGEMMDHLIVNHITAIWLFLVLLNRLEYD